MKQSVEIINSWNKYNRLQQVSLLGFFGFYAYFRLRLRNTMEFAGDEWFTVMNFDKNFYSFFFEFLPKSEYHLPGPFLLIYPIGHFLSVNPFVLSLPYLLLSVSTYWMVARINWWGLLDGQASNSATPQWINVIACGLTTFNVHQQLHSLELRPYSTLSFLSLASLIVVWFLSRERRFRWRYVFALISIILFHNFGMLMIGLAALYIFSFRSGLSLKKEKGLLVQNVKNLILPIKIITLSYLIALPLVVLYFSHASHFLSSVTGGEEVANFGRNTHEFIQEGFTGIRQVFGIYYGLAGPLKKARRIFSTFLLLGSCFFLLMRMWPKLLFPIIFIYLPTTLIYFLAVHSHYWFLQRQFIWVTPYWAVYVAACCVVSLQWSCRMFYKYLQPKFSSCKSS